MFTPLPETRLTIWLSSTDIRRGKAHGTPCPQRLLGFSGDSSGGVFVTAVLFLNIVVGQMCGLCQKQQVAFVEA